MTLRVGSSDDFRAFYVQHYGFVWSVVRRFGVEGPAADDVVQDTFVAAYRRRGDYDGRSPKPWLYGIARRVASNHRRTLARGRERHRVFCELQEPAGEGVSAGRADAVLELDRALSALPLDDRELFFLSEVDGLSGPELAQALRLSPNTVYWRIRRLRGRLAAAVEDPRVDTEATRRGRPQAQASGWVALLPLLDAAPKATAISWGVGGLFGVAALAVTTAAVWTPRVRGDAPPKSVAMQGAADVDVRAGRSSRADASGEGSGTGAGRVPEAVSAAGANAGIAYVGRTARKGSVEVGESERGESERGESERGRSRERKGESIEVGESGLSSAQEISLPSELEARPVSIVPDLRAEETLAAWNLRMRAAWEALERGDPQTALSLTETPGAAPSPPLEDLRITLRVESLCAMGRTDAARELGARFLQDRASTAMRGRLERSCASATKENPSDGQP